MGAESEDGRDDVVEIRICPRPKLYYAAYRWHVPDNPPEWGRMGPKERREWESARELVEQLNRLVHELRERKLVDSDARLF